MAHCLHYPARRFSLSAMTEISSIYHFSVPQTRRFRGAWDACVMSGADEARIVCDGFMMEPCRRTPCLMENTVLGNRPGGRMSWSRRLGVD